MHRLAESSAQQSTQVIRLRGARVHNLQGIDVDIPRDRLVVVTGPSGSGKSSLALDTLYAEGQRQYIETLSVYARQFLQQLERPDVDLLEGLPPTISIDQRPGGPNPRSTVGTITEVYDYLRLLYARLGQPMCHRCGQPIQQQSAEQIVDQLLALPEGTRVMILAPLVRGRKGQHKEVFELIRKAGLVRARVDGQVIDISQPPELVKQKTHNIEAVVDRVVIRQGIRPRIAESVNLAVRHGNGAVLIAHEEPSADGPQWRDQLLSTHYACPNCQIGFEELEPRSFSFNSPYGACPHCDGLGTVESFDAELVLPDRKLSLAQGAVVPWRGDTPAMQQRRKAALRAFMRANGFDWDTPLGRLEPDVYQRLLYGDRKGFAGIIQLLCDEYNQTTSQTRRQHLQTFQSRVRCPQCDGSRLRPEARAVLLGGRAIHQLAEAPICWLRRWLGELAFPAQQQPIARPITAEILARLAFLDDVGLDYLTLNRPADSLSGGELQRVRLAAGLGAGLVGVCYILDEPSVGLHPRDNQRLIDALRRLQSAGNSVLVVEHDETIMRQADWLIDLGPGAGRNGGRIVAQGPPAAVADNPASPTGRYLSGREQIPLPAARRRVAKNRAITLQGVTTNNLKNITVSFPLSVLVCVTGVSGSGKSSLVIETLAPALMRALYGAGPAPGPYQSLRGVKQIDKVVQIDQTPIGRTPRSNPATYCGAFDEIRKVFASTRDARRRGFKAGRFSFNVRGGRCEQCQGQGQQRIEMNFLPDLYVPCPVCQGKRFNRQTLAVRYRDRSIADVLDMSVDEAVEFFANFPTLARLLGSLQEVGLGYMALGQPSTTLSGGEAQRVKLAAELGRLETGKTLYILDEPTTGLHFQDIKRLLGVLNRLVDRGNTVVVIEHNLDVIKSADWLIDLGPEGGDAGGYVVATGTPEQLATLPDNHTGAALRRVLADGQRG